MRWYRRLAIAAMLSAFAAVAVHGEQIKYYVWVDENGVTHMEDKPPKDREYETRIIEFGANVAPSSPPPRPERW